MWEGLGAQQWTKHSLVSKRDIAQSPGHPPVVFLCALQLFIVKPHRKARASVKLLKSQP